MTATKFWVDNICGGTIYCGRSEEKAIKATEDHYATPYIHSEAGARPVVRYTLDEQEDTDVGEIGESYEDAVARLRNDLARYGDRAFV